MKIVVVHGQSHKGVTYTATHKVIDNLGKYEEYELKEFFLPNDGPTFCYGCNNCFLKGEDECPEAMKVQPIWKAILWADIVILDTPVYVMDMSGAMKNLLDHFAYAWVTHRPEPSMFKKVGIAACSSAGAPCGSVTKSLASKLGWMCIGKVVQMPFISSAMNKSDISPEKMKEIEKKSLKTATKAYNFIKSPHTSIKTKFLFGMMRKMQCSDDAAWNPTDQNWWKEHGFTGKTRPWNNK